jgi:hypothetical protein
MANVLYTDEEGGYWKSASFDDMSEEGIQKLCEVQKLSNIKSSHRVHLTNGIKAAAVLFYDGRIWDAILSRYDTTSRRGLAKCLQS